MAEASEGKRIGDYVVSKRVLGRGMYGKVYLGTHVRTGKNVAVKKLTQEKEYVTEESEKEAKVMMHIPDHVNLLKLLDYKKTEKKESRKESVQFWFIVEYCPLGSLEDFAKSKQLSVCEKVDLAAQCARAVHHLHSQVPSVIHRDIKAANILIAGSPDKPVAKLADLGCARLIEKKDGRSVPMNSVIGTPLFNAPELFSTSLLHTKSIDVFSLAVTFLAVVDAETGIKVTKVHGEVLGRYLLSKPAGFTYNIHKSGDSDDVREMKNVLSPMLARNPAARPGIHSVLQSLDDLFITMRARQLGFSQRVKSNPQPDLAAQKKSVLLHQKRGPLLTSTCEVLQQQPTRPDAARTQPDLVAQAKSVLKDCKEMRDNIETRMNFLGGHYRLWEIDPSLHRELSQMNRRFNEIHTQLSAVLPYANKRSEQRHLLMSLDELYVDSKPLLTRLDAQAHKALDVRVNTALKDCQDIREKIASRVYYLWGGFNESEMDPSLYMELSQMESKFDEVHTRVDVVLQFEKKGSDEKMRLLRSLKQLYEDSKQVLTQLNIRLTYIN